MTPKMPSWWHPIEELKWGPPIVAVSDGSNHPSTQFHNLANLTTGPHPQVPLEMESMKANKAYHVVLEKEELIFSAAHFITFNGGVCERLHGHNYRIQCEVVGELDENGYVIDFIFLRDTLKSIATSLHHRMLLPELHPKILVSQSDTEVTAAFEDRRWVFPKDDCLILPIDNTTAEQLARYIGDCLFEQMDSERCCRLERVVVRVDENEGQWGCCEFTPG